MTDSDVSTLMGFLHFDKNVQFDVSVGGLHERSIGMIRNHIVVRDK
jgi:hypothetical protein